MLPVKFKFKSDVTESTSRTDGEFHRSNDLDCLFEFCSILKPPNTEQLFVVVL